MVAKEETKKGFQCPNGLCKSYHTVRHGYNVTKKRGKLPRRKCQECGTTFYENKEDKK